MYYLPGKEWTKKKKGKGKPKDVKEVKSVESSVVTDDGAKDAGSNSVESLQEMLDTKRKQIELEQRQAVKDEKLDQPNSSYGTYIYVSLPFHYD